MDRALSILNLIASGKPGPSFGAFFLTVQQINPCTNWSVDGFLSINHALAEFPPPHEMLKTMSCQEKSQLNLQ